MCFSRENAHPNFENFSTDQFFKNWFFLVFVATLRPFVTKNGQAVERDKPNTPMCLPP
jgi:hypothetical protein